MSSTLLRPFDIVEFVNMNSLVMVKFFAHWSTGCARIRPHYEILANRFKQCMNFASVDVDFVGLDDINALQIRLNIGAIPAFYLFRNGQIVNTLITGSENKLEAFILANIDKDLLTINVAKPTGSFVLNRTKKTVKKPVRRSISCYVRPKSRFSSF